jgi:hypothetical protein
MSDQALEQAITAARLAVTKLSELVEGGDASSVDINRLSQSAKRLAELEERYDLAKRLEKLEEKRSGQEP